MKSFLKKYKYWVLAIFLNIALFASAPYLNKKGKERRLSSFERGVYSLGLVTEFRNETRSDHYRYTFQYGGEMYKSRYYYDGIHLEVGKHYFLIIDPENPNYNNFLLPIFPVPDNITEAPPEGWKELPIPVDKEEIKKFLEDY